MDDTISRRAAIDALRVAYWDYDIQSVKDDPCVVDAMTDWAIRQIKALPSAEPETAKRIVGKSRDGMTLWYQCDMCNEPVDAQDNYCRGCGRRLTDERHD